MLVHHRLLPCILSGCTKTLAASVLFILLARDRLCGELYLQQNLSSYIFFVFAADIKPSVMIVEEAAEILEGQLVAVIPPSVQHLIMIGDHKQLKPVVHFHRLKKKHHLDLSMFERLVNCNLPYIQLGQQCRMKDEVADLLRELKIYSTLRTNVKVTSWSAGTILTTSAIRDFEHGARR